MYQAIVERACAKLRSAIGDEAVARLNFTADLRDMLEALESIQLFLEDAEVAQWLQHVWSAAYKTIETIDELQDARSHVAAKKTRMLPRLAIMKNDMAIMKNDMAIEVQKTKELVMSAREESRDFSEYIMAEKPMYQEHIVERITRPVFEEAMILGRGPDKEKIIAALLSTESNIMQEHTTILPIFGLVAIGKTTLAEMVFNDTHSLQGYDFRLWVHVSPQFDFHTIGKSIICHVLGKGQQEINHSSSDVEGMESIMKHLHKLLNGKKVLLVLDDLWEEDPILLQLLKSMLTFLGDKMDVIVTTCNQAIARRICTVEPYRLNRLSDDTCWEIIKKLIHFEGGEEELEKIGGEITGKCWGVPSIARGCARILDSSRDAMTWKKTMEENVWFIIMKYGSVAFSSMLLCYRSMPPDLRLCFAYYCQIFPTSHNIVKDDLVHQWIALQLTKPSEILSATQIAEEHITRLQDLSFLQTAELNHASGKDDKGVILFTVHALVHDVVKRIVDSFNYCLVTNHHGRLVINDNLRALHCVGCSKVEFDGYSFSRQRFLRVLELKESPVQKLPDSIWQLKYLGYLKISEFSGLVTLPESLGDLINLFHIDLSGCSGLINLPESFGKLICLVHVDLSGCSGLVTLPRSFGELINVMHINLSGCSGLVTLPESFGKLVNLVRINLSGCSGLVTLPESFGKLVNLVRINLSGCSGLTTLPESFGKLICLVEVNLSGCSGLATLTPAFGQLINVMHINLSGCSGLITLPESFGKLVSLMRINLSGCSGLTALPESFGDLVNIEHINLSRCHGMAELPKPLEKLGKLVHLDLSFWSCFEGIGEGLGGLTNLEHLNLSHPCCYLVQHRSHLQGLKDGLCKLTKLRYLNLSMCLNSIFYYYQPREDNLQYIGDCLRGLSSLEHLDLSHNTFLFDLPTNLCELNKLHTLDLSGCIRIKKVRETKSLKIIIDLSKCQGLESCQLVVRVDEAAYISTSNLVQLEVVDCKELEISCLERLKSLDEAQRIKLVEKQKVERLKLCWTVGEVRGHKTVEENALLGELVPPQSLQCLGICGYGGETCLPAWRIPSISSHFRNLTEVTMEDFPRCVVLPPLGLFPNLQHLVLRRMARITRIDAGELSGGNREAFTRLSKFTIDDMENLNEFKFAAVDELAIQKCPLLSFGSLLPRAQRLLISNCDQLMSSSVGGIDGVEGPSAPVTELVVKSCNAHLGDWSLLHHLPGLCSLTINNCYKLTSSSEIIGALSSLQSLCFSQFHQRMASLPVFLCDLTSLRQLAIDGCHGIKSLPRDMVDKLTGLKSLYVWDCPELKKWCETEENKQKLAHIQVKFEKFDTSKTGVHPPEI